MYTNISYVYCQITSRIISDRRACACLDTSGVASLRQTSTRPRAKKLIWILAVFLSIFRVTWNCIQIVLVYKAHLSQKTQFHPFG